VITTTLEQSDGLTQYNVNAKVDPANWGGIKKITVPVWAPADCEDIDGIVAAARTALDDPTARVTKVFRGMYTQIAKF
jgi:hypothetical protein